MSKKLIIYVLVLSLFSIYSCNKSNVDLEVEPVNEPQSEIQSSKLKTSIYNIWGVDIYRRVYRWNDTRKKWDEPNPNARLRQVSAGNNGAVWGYGTSNRIYIWNENSNSWDEPNKVWTDSKLPVTIGCYNSLIAMTVCSDGNVYRTTNGGNNWTAFDVHPGSTTFSNSAIISVGSSDLSNIWISDNGAVYYYETGNYAGGGRWVQLSGYRFASPTFDSGNYNAWLLNSSSVYPAKVENDTYPVTPVPYYAGNPTTFSCISGAFFGDVWAIGPDFKVYRSQSGGAWDEPNPNAKLSQISVGM